MDKQKIVDGLEKAKDVSVTAAKATAKGAKKVGVATVKGAKKVGIATKKAAVKAKDVTVEKVKNIKVDISEEQMHDILDKCYEKAVDGVPKISEPLEKMVNDYLKKYKTQDEAINALVKYQIAKCGTSGFITSLGGIITMPIGIPANIGSVLYVQLRMIAAIAKIGGYDITSDQVQTLVFTCLTGSAAADILKQSGIKIGEKMTEAAIKKIPGALITKINQMVGFRLITKFGEKGVINLVELIPVVGGVIGGGVDVFSTLTIANNAKRLFIGGKDIIEADVIDETIFPAKKENNDINE